MNWFIEEGENCNTHPVIIIIIIIKKLFTKNFINHSAYVYVCISDICMKENFCFFHQLNQNSIESNKQNKQMETEISRKNSNQGPKEFNVNFYYCYYYYHQSIINGYQPEEKKNSNGPQGILHRERKWFGNIKKIKYCCCCCWPSLWIFFFLFIEIMAIIPNKQS